LYAITKPANSFFSLLATSDYQSSNTTPQDPSIDFDFLQTTTLTMAEPASDRLLIQRALILLNLQRAQLFGTTTESGDPGDGRVHRWVTAAIAKVNTRQSVRTLGS
jgi:hypothetical protein